MFVFWQSPHTYRENGSVEFGDHVMLKSLQVEGWLVCDLADKVTSCDEAYGVTTTPKQLGPVARSVFVIERGDDKDGSPDNCVHFGQKVRITTNAQIMHKPLYLHSVPITPLAYARFSRNQEVSLCNQKVYNTMWTI